MSGYGIAGANEQMARILADSGWQKRGDGFYLLDPGDLGRLVQTVRNLDGCAVPAGCCLFTTGEVVDLGAASGSPAGEGANADAGQAVGGAHKVARRRPMPPDAQDAADLAYLQGLAGAQPPDRPGDPVAAMIASGLFDEDTGPDVADIADSLAREQNDTLTNGSARDADGRQTAGADSQADDDDYSVEMMRMFGLR